MCRITVLVHLRHQRQATGLMLLSSSSKRPSKLTTPFYSKFFAIRFQNGLGHCSTYVRIR
ncbi:hypothetical protein KP509_05G004300 [Ceratopteris richardii]|nr:hypothetical protein KP509_05G004300 [Ceratopteris richardii]